VNPYTQDLLGRNHRDDLDREADHARLVASARAAGPGGVSTPAAATTANSRLLSRIAAELRRTRQWLVALERMLGALAQH
jgi:hypothetical protein